MAHSADYTVLYVFFHLVTPIKNIFLGYARYPLTPPRQNVLNVATESEYLTIGDRLFQTVGPATEKTMAEHSPSFLVDTRVSIEMTSLWLLD